MIRSPSVVKLQHKIDIETKKIEHEHHIDDDRIENTWSSCCFHIDRRACIFVSQMIVLVLTICFCASQLIILDKCDSDPYLGLLTLCIGVIIPSPMFKKRNDID